MASRDASTFTDIDTKVNKNDPFLCVRSITLLCAFLMEISQKVRYFLQTVLQQESFFQYQQPNLTIDEYHQATEVIEKIFPHSTSRDLIDKLYQSVDKIREKNIVPPLVYDKMLLLYTMFEKKVLGYPFIRQMKRKKEADEKKSVISVEDLEAENLDEKDYTLIVDKYQQKYLRKVAFTNQKIVDPTVNYDRKIIAESYIKYGYGVLYLRKYCLENDIDFKLPSRKYCTILTSITMETFRYIEGFVEEFAKLSTFRIEKQRLGTFYQCLLNLKMHLRTKDFEYFSLFMKFLYGIGEKNIQITVFEVYQAYQNILKLACSKNKFTGGELKNKINSISAFLAEKRNSKNASSEASRDDPDYPTFSKWNGDKELELARLYMEESDYVKVRERYRQKYGLITMFENIRLLRNYVESLVRKSYRIVITVSRSSQGRIKEQTQRNLSSIQEGRGIPKILTNPEFTQCRVLLCQFFLERKKNFTLIEAIASELRAAVDRMNSKRKDGSRQ